MKCLFADKILPKKKGKKERKSGRLSKGGKISSMSQVNSSFVCVCVFFNNFTHIIVFIQLWMWGLIGLQLV